MRIFGKSEEWYTRMKAAFYVQNPNIQPEDGELPKIGRWMAACFRRMRDLYIPMRECSFDEMIAGFKGRCRFLFDKMKKPTSSGLKVFGYCESKTGFVLDGEVDQRNKRSIKSFILDLARRCFPKKSGHMIYMIQ